MCIWQAQVMGAMFKVDVAWIFLFELWGVVARRAAAFYREPEEALLIFCGSFRMSQRGYHLSWCVILCRIGAPFSSFTSGYAGQGCVVCFASRMTRRACQNPSFSKRLMSALETQTVVPVVGRQQLRVTGASVSFCKFPVVQTSNEQV